MPSEEETYADLLRVKDLRHGQAKMALSLCGRYYVLRQKDFETPSCKVAFTPLRERSSHHGDSVSILQPSEMGAAISITESVSCISLVSGTWFYVFRNVYIDSPSLELVHEIDDCDVNYAFYNWQPLVEEIQKITVHLEEEKKARQDVRRKAHLANDILKLRAELGLQEGK